MNIAIIENNIIATNTIRRKLVDVLVEKGHTIAILTTGTDEQINETILNGYNVINVHGSNQHPAEVVRYMRNIYRALKKTDAEVCLTFTIRPAIWGNIVTRILKIPTITNVTGIGPLFERNNIAYRTARTLYRFVLKSTNRIFFQNYDDMNIFLEKGFVRAGKAERIPGSGIDFEHYQPLPRSGPGNFTFLFISRLVRDKGIVEYIDAARELKKQVPEMRFLVAGPIWKQNLKDNTIEEKQINAWVREGIIEYKGEVKDVRLLIADADCIVLPSYREGTSNVLLEASSMEKPCITCDTTGCREIVEDGVTGYLCKVKDAKDLAIKMKKLYELDPLARLSMGKKARQKVIAEYDKKIVIDAYLRAIENVKFPNE